MNYQLWFKEIYDKVFCKTYSASYYVFLCGGAGKDCIRDSMRYLLEKHDYQILYPEDLFVDVIYRDKKADLLDYENLLAQNADAVCVICESPGSFAELGAFVQSDQVNKRLVVAVNEKYKRQKSFIMLGPVRHQKKISEKSVVYYNTDEQEEFAKKLSSSFERIKKKYPRSHERIPFSMLSAYIVLIPIILFFFQSLPRKILHKEMKIFLKSIENFPANYNILFNAAIKYLTKMRIVSTSIETETKMETFSLTLSGIKNTKALMSKTVAAYPNRLHDRIRCGIMKSQLKSHTP